MARWEREMVGNVPAHVLDPQARERVGDLLRTARDARPRKLEAGTVVEFLRGGHLTCGYLRSTPMTRKGLLIVDRDGQERRLRSDRILHHGLEQVAVTPLERGLDQLHTIDRMRQIAADKIDLVTLRELAIEVAGQTHTWRVAELARIHDSTDRPTSLQCVAMLRALYAGQEFRRVVDDWIARSPEALHGARASRRREADKRQHVADQAGWLLRVAEGGEYAPAPADVDHLLQDLATYAVSSTDEEPGEIVHLVHAAHLHGRAAVTDLLKRLGYWDADENLILHREAIPQQFTPEAQAQSKLLCSCQPLWRGWPSWGHASIGITDPVDDQICLRAWSVRKRRRGGWRLRLHVALPGLWLREGGVLVEEIADRGVTIELPDRRLPMIPSDLLRACSFTTTTSRPALSFVVDLDASGRLLDARLRRTRLRLRAMLASSLTATEGKSQAREAVTLATQLREGRRAAGAWEYLGGERRIQAIDSRPTCSRVGVQDLAAIDREILFIGEQAAARICQSAQVATIYRTRAPAMAATPAVPDLNPASLSDTWPDAWLEMEGDARALYDRWQMEGHVASESLQLDAAGHSGTGSGPRALGVSPADSHGELLMQQQLLALVGDGKVRTARTMESWLQRQQACQEAADTATRAGRRHWCLRWLAAHQDHRLGAWVAARRGAGYLILFDELPMSAWVPAGGEMTAQAGDRLTVAIERVNVRGDELLLADPRRETSPA
ncbi:MAG: RNB domain-containing ribonuclease [Gemmatimonadetes bacterium]|nr:RNB domain-containing ribonuclease [Gemmatimonadota bacterium]